MKLIQFIALKSRVFIVLFFFMAFTSCDQEENQPESPSEIPEGYRLVWSDEFTVDGLPDAEKWNFDTEANETGWYNDELQYYADSRLENARVSEGTLKMIARKK